MLAGILGGTGFIGSYLCRHLAGHTQRPVRLLVRNSLLKSPIPPAEVVTGDLLSRADCEQFASGLDVIYYLAHTNTPLNSDLDQPTDAALNLVPLLNLLDAIRRLGSRPHVVYFSSGGAVYAPRPGLVPYRESDPCAPASSYGILKITAEQYLRLAAERCELTATVLRVGNAYGTLLPEYRMQGLIGVALNHLLHGNPVRVFGNPGNVRDYVHLEDVCAMALRAATPWRPFDVFNVGTGRGHSVDDILAIIRDCHGAPFPISTDAACGRRLTDWVVLDCSHALQEVGWSAAIDLRAGIAGMLSAWRVELRAQPASAL
jgi:UDP-glucose 4-epimerase